MYRNSSEDLGKRNHLTKNQRLPQCFKDTEKIIKSVKLCRSNFKTILANTRFRGNHFKKVYSLSLNVLKHYDYLQKILDHLQIMEKEKLLRREIASILIYEIIFGKGYLSGESKPVLTIENYRDDIIKVHEEFQSCSVLNSKIKALNLPRYARIHTLVTTVSCVIKDLQNCGFQQIDYPADISEEKYIELIGNLDKQCFVIDLHFKDLLVFAYNKNLTNLELYHKKHIFLQDKSSCIPVHVLNPEPGSTVIDACAAPGMKSMHIAAKMRNKGLLIACEKDTARFETLKQMLNCGNVKISKMFCKDFKLIDPNDQAFSSVDYILLDPSCSGSGMVNRLDEAADAEGSKSHERLQKLGGFQIILLKHALKFPFVKRIVYSTCSIHEEENEYVVQEALNAYYNVFSLVPVMPEWPVRGLESYECGQFCLRTIPEKHLTNGFFVAVFERIDDKGIDNAITPFAYKETKLENINCRIHETSKCNQGKKGQDISSSLYQNLSESVDVEFKPKTDNSEDITKISDNIKLSRVKGVKNSSGKQKDKSHSLDRNIMNCEHFEKVEYERKNVNFVSNLKTRKGHKKKDKNHSNIAIEENYSFHAQENDNQNQYLHNEADNRYILSSVVNVCSKLKYGESSNEGFRREAVNPSLTQQNIETGKKRHKKKHKQEHNSSDTFYERKVSSRKHEQPDQLQGKEMNYVCIQHNGETRQEKHKKNHIQNCDSPDILFHEIKDSSTNLVEVHSKVFEKEVGSPLTQQSSKTNKKKKKQKLDNENCNSVCGELKQSPQKHGYANVETLQSEDNKPTCVQQHIEIKHKKHKKKHKQDHDLFDILSNETKESSQKYGNSSCTLFQEINTHHSLQNSEKHGHANVETLQSEDKKPAYVQQPIEIKHKKHRKKHKHDRDLFDVLSNETKGSSEKYGNSSCKLFQEINTHHSLQNSEKKQKKRHKRNYDILSNEVKAPEEENNQTVKKKNDFAGNVSDNDFTTKSQESNSIFFEANNVLQKSHKHKKKKHKSNM